MRRNNRRNVVILTAINFHSHPADGKEVVLPTGQLYGKEKVHRTHWTKDIPRRVTKAEARELGLPSGAMICDMVIQSY